MKEYTKIPEIFVQLINGCIFAGEQVVECNSLKEIDTTSVPSAHSQERIRDILKIETIQGQKRIFGIESQANIDTTMVVRTMLYDALTYMEQIKEKRAEYEANGIKINNIKKLPYNAKIVKVITMIFYTGDEKWSAPKSIFDFTKTNNNIHNNNYEEDDFKMPIVDARHLTTEQIACYTGDVYVLFKILNEGKKLLDEQLDGLKVKYRKTLLVLAKILKDDRYRLMAEAMPEEDEEGRNMCELMDAVEKRGEKQGELSGAVKLLKIQGEDASNIIKVVCNIFHADENEVKKYLN